MTKERERLEIASAGELRNWLEANHEREASVWLVTWKKSTPEKYVSTDEVLDELLCFGWIDGRRLKLDDARTMQLVSPRRHQHWAKTYKDRAARLERDGRMREPGAKAIEASKRNGLWSFMDDVDALIVPDDLETALKRRPPATRRFAGFSASSRRNMLRWLKLAKTERTRAARIERIATLASRNEKIPQM